MDRAKEANPAAIIHIIDDDTNLSGSLVDLFESIGMRAIAFKTANDFLNDADLTMPGCVLLDVKMPGMTGLELQAKLAELRYPLPIIFMTGDPNVATSVSAMKAGAFDFLLKPFKLESLVTLLRLALERNADLRAKQAATLHAQATVDTLTPREAEVFGYVAKGMMNKQIAHEMNISEIMVKLHRGRMMKKLEARSVPDVVRKFDEVNRNAAEALGR
ncbi:response regulator transcription factor [Rhizobium grahamii]|uniref:DNA-binding response regulator n=1 Tax=Rhizobium grahamii TaxID=1120045 RepID=A0A370KTH0_9HYPH|nr:response regulator [Rhizobium grahamii]RDJ13946.1 DNA-binding response regulator [Rhizobium grahamii]